MPIPNSTQLQRMGHWWLKTWLICIVKETTKQKTEEKSAALWLLLKNYRYTKLFSQEHSHPKKSKSWLSNNTSRQAFVVLGSCHSETPTWAIRQSKLLASGRKRFPTNSQFTGICHHFPAPRITTFILWENLVVPGISSPACAEAHPSFTDKESALCRAMAQSWH